MRTIVIVLALMWSGSSTSFGADCRPEGATIFLKSVGNFVCEVMRREGAEPQRVRITAPAQAYAYFADSDVSKLLANPPAARKLLRATWDLLKNSTGEEFPTVELRTPDNSRFGIMDLDVNGRPTIKIGEEARNW